MYDGVVIGGGPAGMFAAITAGRAGKRIALLERNDRLGKKLRITGKGRCNVTNNCTPQEALQNVPRNGRFLFSALDAFPPERVMAFFEDMGCPLKTERGNRVFPQSDSALSIQEALNRALEQAGVEVLTARAKEILTREGAVTGVLTDRGSFYAPRVILATGGCSYPATGSTGDGYEMARALGHTIVEPVGSLVPPGDGRGGRSQHAGPLLAERGSEAPGRKREVRLPGLWRAAVHPLRRLRPHGIECQRPYGKAGSLHPGS